MSEIIVCRPKSLPRSLWIAAGNTASKINPLNHAPVEQLVRALPDFKPTAEHLALVTSKYWHSNGVRLTVGFLDSPPADLRRRILLHMNAWSLTAKVKFTHSRTDPQVRIARAAGAGYWSYVGTDILHVASDQPTMNLEAFTMQTPETEYLRVVRHETGHTIGFPHERMRRELVAKIDPKKAYDFFAETQGWSKADVRAQVLTPLDQWSLLAAGRADPRSIMSYQVPGSITKDGKPIIGGRDIDREDRALAALLYPK